MLRSRSQSECVINPRLPGSSIPPFSDLLSRSLIFRLFARSIIESPRVNRDVITPTCNKDPLAYYRRAAENGFQILTTDVPGVALGDLGLELEQVSSFLTILPH